MLPSITLSGNKFRVVKRGFSQSIRLPLAMLKRATIPLPLPCIDWMSKSCRFNSFIWSVPNANCAVLVEISGSSA